MKKIILIMIGLSTNIYLYARTSENLFDISWLDKITGFLSGRLAMGIGVAMIVFTAFIYFTGQGSDQAKVMAFRVCLGISVILNAGSIATKLFGAGLVL